LRETLSQIICTVSTLF